MKLLLTNDDGIDAPGLQALLRSVAGFGEAWLVAPAGPQSGSSHRVTTDDGLRVEQQSDRRFAIHGTPGDCTRVGLNRLLPDADWVISGINHGGNLGADVYYSGTVAAAREAVLHGKRAIALSHFRAKGRDYDWEIAAGWAELVIRELLSRPYEKGTFWNVNFPHPLPGQPEPVIRDCAVDPHPLPLSYRLQDDLLHYDGEYHHRKREPDCDVEVCFGGNIAVSRIRLG